MHWDLLGAWAVRPRARVATKEPQQVQLGALPLQPPRSLKLSICKSLVSSLKCYYAHPSFDIE